MEGATFAGKFGFRSTTEGIAGYLTSARNPGLPIYPEINGTAIGDAEKAILYERSDNSFIVVLVVPPALGSPLTLAYLKGEPDLGFVTTGPAPADAQPLRIASLGTPGTWSILNTNSGAWTPLAYDVSSQMALLTYAKTGIPLAAEPVTPGYAALAQSKQGQQADLRYCDLTGLDMGGVDFTGADFTGAILTGTVFTGATLTAAVFTGAVLQRTDFTGASLDRAVLADLDLSSVIWGPGVSANGTHFDGSLMSGCHIRAAANTMASFTGAFFTGADLGGANLSNTDLTSATFYGANLTGAVLTSANLTDANLGGGASAMPATLAYALMSNVTLTGANLFGVNFTFATLYGAGTLVNSATTIQEADFSNAYLEAISFEKSNLQGARFDGACLIGANFTGAELGASAANSMPASFVGACLPGAIFTGAFITGTNFANAAISFQQGSFPVRFCMEAGPFPPAPDLFNINSNPTTGLDLTTLQPSTVCPNGSTLATNQSRGLELDTMLTAPGAPVQWIAASCMVH